MWRCVYCSLLEETVKWTSAAFKMTNLLQNDYIWSKSLSLKKKILVVECRQMLSFRKSTCFFSSVQKELEDVIFELSQRNLQGEPELSRGSYSPACLSCQHRQTRMHPMWWIPNYYNFQLPERLINGDKVRRCQHSVCMQELWECRINGLTLNCKLLSLETFLVFVICCPSAAQSHHMERICCLGCSV